MFCPRCGDEFTEIKGVFHCERGEMELSILTAEELIEYFNGNNKPEHCLPLSFEPEGIWFCPRCGVQMAVDKNTIQCPACHRCMNRFVRQLLELHPHRDERGMWPWH